MSGIAIVLMVVTMGVTLAVLFAGLFTMAKGGEFDRKHSNRLMRWRIMAQAAALLMFALAMLLK